MILSQIHLYPLKSAAGIPLRKGKIDTRGLQFDRRWMLVDPENNFVSQRKHPRMALITPSILPPDIIFNAPGMEPLQLQLLPRRNNQLTVKIWKDRSLAMDCGGEAARWFSEFLESPVRLAFQPPEAHRPIDARFSINAHSVSFADGFPFLLISEASLAALNSRLSEAVPMNRFRPNLVVAGCEPFAEDRWKTIRIGAVLFEVVKPCARCVITTIDQASGKTGKEPLKTLATFRRSGQKVLFGQNLIHHSPGSLHAGDQVSVVKLKSGDREYNHFLLTLH